MRAFKKLMAGAIATAIAATMATSAFAAGFDAETGKVTAEYTAVGQTTVLVVPADVWVNNAITGLEDADILYINQYEDAATANTAIAAGFGVKLNDEGTLTDGDYYALFGGNTGVEGAFAITAVAFNVTNTPEGPQVSTVKGDVTGDYACDIDDLVKLAKHVGQLEFITDAQELTNADVTNDENCDIDDLVKVAKFVGQLITSFDEE